MSYAFVHLARFDLPGHTARLTDGGAFTWDSAEWRSSDSLLGSIGRVDVPEEGVGSDVPAIQITFLPPASAAPSDLAQPGWQTSRARFWLAEYDPATGAITGTPESIFDGFFDQAKLIVGLGKRELGVTIVSEMERLFSTNVGNAMTPAFHQSVWPGETGQDQATGLVIPVAWGTTAPPAAVSTSVPGSFATRGLVFTL